MPSDSWCSQIMQMRIHLMRVSIAAQCANVIRLRLNKDFRREVAARRHEGNQFPSPTKHE